MSNKKKDMKRKYIGSIAMVIVMTIVVMIVTSFLSLIGFDAQKAVVVTTKYADIPYSVEMTMTVVKNIFSLDGLKFLISNVVLNLSIFEPLMLFIIFIMAISLGEASGLFENWFSGLKKMSINKLNFILLFTSIVSSFFGEYSYIIMLPTAAILYKHAKKNPVLGIIIAFIGVTIGSGAGLIFNYNDVLLGLKTQVAANLERNNSYVYHLGSTIFISLTSTLLLSFFGTKIIEHFLLSKIDNKIDGEEKIEEPNIKKATLISIISLIVMLLIIIYSIIPGLPASGLLLDMSQNRYIEKLMVEGSPFRDGFIFLISLVLIITSLTYGYFSKKIKDSHDFSIGLTKEFDKLGYFFVIMFVVSQLVAILNWTNIGEVITARLTQIISTLQFTGLPLIIVMMVIVLIATFIMPSTLAKWQLMSPIVVPLFMRANITPDFTQFIFVVADGVGKLFAPLFIYYLIMLGFLQKYKKEEEKFTVFGVMRLLMPTLLYMSAIWLLIILGWYIVGLPLGINVFPTI
jgi:aminobenzoyl-glutamate transport protein